MLASIKQALFLAEFFGDRIKYYSDVFDENPLIYIQIFIQKSELYISIMNSFESF